MTARSERAVSPVVGVILTVAITVILAAVVGTFALNVGDETEDKGPYVGGDFESNISTEGQDCKGSGQQYVQITHQGGKDIPVENLMIVVETEKHETNALIRDFPLPDSNYATDNIEGNDNIIDSRNGAFGYDCFAGPIEHGSPDVWKAGMTIEFRINHGVPPPSTPGNDLKPGDRVMVRIVDEKNGRTLMEEEFEARAP